MRLKYINMAKGSKKSSKHSRKCPSGKIRRKSYSRKGHERSSHARKSRKSHKRLSVRGSYVDRTHVPASCVPDKGKHGKTPKAARILPKLGKELSLRRYGYATDAPEEKRMKALRHAARQHGHLKTLRRLNLLRNYQADPTAKKIMAQDVDAMSEMYKVHKIQQGRVKDSKKSSSRRGHNKKSSSRRGHSKKH